MKIFASKKVSIVVAVVAVILLLAAIVFYIMKKPSQPEAAAVTISQEEAGATSPLTPSLKENKETLPSDNIPSEKVEEEPLTHEVYSAALLQILTTGNWTDNLDNTVLSFTDTSYTAVNQSTVTGITDTIACDYRVISVDAKDDVYKVSWEMTDKNGSSYTVSDITISVKNDNQYTLFSGSFPFARTFTKTADILFTLPDESTPADNTNSTLGNAIISPTNETEYSASLSIAVEAALIGKWTGSLQDMAESPAWSYVFMDDGQYRFYNGEITITGTYTISHNAGELYHATLHLQNAAGSKDLDFYFSGQSPVMMTIAGGQEPNYKKV